MRIFFCFNEAAQVYAAFCILHELLPPTTMVKNDTANSRMMRRTAKQSLDSFFMRAILITDWEAYEKSAARSSQAIIGYIGSDVKAPTSIIVYYDGMKYIAGSTTAAIDLCLQLFFLFNAKYPEDSLNVWHFINEWFYQIEVPKKEKKQIHKCVPILCKELRELSI